MYVELVISFFKFVYISFLDFVDGDDRAIGDEYILFLDKCFVDIFVCDLNSVGNELNCWVVVWVRSLAYDAFEDCCVIRRCAEFVNNTQ